MKKYEVVEFNNDGYGEEEVTGFDDLEKAKAYRRTVLEHLTDAENKKRVVEIRYDFDTEGCDEGCCCGYAIVDCLLDDLDAANGKLEVKPGVTLWTAGALTIAGMWDEEFKNIETWKNYLWVTSSSLESPEGFDDIKDVEDALKWM